MKRCIELMPLILPREQEIKVRGVHYKVGDTVWIPATNSWEKTVRCVCCGRKKVFYFGEWNMISSKVKEVHIVLKGTVPEVTYVLEDGGIRDAVHIFPTEAGAKRWARAKAARNNIVERERYDRARARNKKFKTRGR